MNKKWEISFSKSWHWWQTFEDLSEEVCIILIVEGRVAAEKDVGDDSNAPNIHGFSIRLLCKHLQSKASANTINSIDTSTNTPRVLKRIRSWHNKTIPIICPNISNYRNTSGATYPGVPQAVAITPDSSILERPKSLIMILLSASGLEEKNRLNATSPRANSWAWKKHTIVRVQWTPFTCSRANSQAWGLCEQLLPRACKQRLTGPGIKVIKVTFYSEKELLWCYFTCLIKSAASFSE